MVFAVTSRTAGPSLSPDVSRTRCCHYCVRRAQSPTAVALLYVAHITMRTGTPLIYIILRIGSTAGAPTPITQHADHSSGVLVDVDCQLDGTKYPHDTPLSQPTRCRAVRVGAGSRVWQPPQHEATTVHHPHRSGCRALSFRWGGSECRVARLGWNLVLMRRAQIGSNCTKFSM